MSLQQDIDKAIATLNKLPRVVADNRKRISEEGARVIVSALGLAAPRSEKTHYRYATDKVNKSMRAPKGMGNKVATYEPGNLENSIRMLNLSKVKTGTYVGARLAKGNTTGTFGTSRFDGYYAGMVVGGTRHSAPNDFWWPAVEKATPAALGIMLRQWIRLIEEYGLNNQVDSNQLSLF